MRRQGTALPRHDQQIIGEWHHAPTLSGRHRFKGRVQLLQLPARLAYKLAQFRLTLAIQVLMDAAEWEALGLVDADGEQLETMLLGERAEIRARRCLQLTECPNIPDRALGQGLGDLPIGGLDAVGFTPVLDVLGQFFE